MLFSCSLLSARMRSEAAAFLSVAFALVALAGAFFGLAVVLGLAVVAFFATVFLGLEVVAFVAVFLVVAALVALGLEVVVFLGAAAGFLAAAAGLAGFSTLWILKLPDAPFPLG